MVLISGENSFDSCPSRRVSCFILVRKELQKKCTEEVVAIALQSLLYRGSCYERRQEQLNEKLQ